MKFKATLFATSSMVLLLSGCGDAPPPPPRPSPSTGTGASAPANTGTGTGAAANTGTGVAASTGTGTGTGADTKADAGGRTKIGSGPHSVAMPASWKIQNVQKPMRALTVTVAKSEGDAEDAELSVFVFPGNAGGVDANITRWANQFGGDKSIKDTREVKTEAGKTAKIVEIEGDFAGGMGAPAKPNSKMLGSFIETEDGAHVFKLVGSPKTLNDHKAEFDKMIESFK
jgi:hypothetical protein